MALVVKDRVKQTTTTTGTGSIVLNGNVSGFQTFTAALSNGDTTYYGIFEPSTNEYEVGLGTWTESSATLARTTVLESSNSGSAVNLTAQAEVFITQPAEKAVYLDSSNNVTLGNDLTVTGDLTVNGTTTTIDTTNTVVTDSLIELANGTTGSPSNDAGIVIERGDSNNAFIGYDESADKFTVGTGSFTGASTGNLTITTGTLVANVEGNVTGNADTATTAGTVTTAAQPNITSVGTLTSAVISGDLTVDTSTLKVDSSNNRVGIGTASPSRDLTIKGFTGFEASNSTNAWAVYTYTDNTLRLNYNGSGNDEVVIDSSGNFGIGSSTANHFSTAGTANVLGVKSTSGGLISVAATGTNFSGIDLGTDAIRRGGMYSLNGSHLAFYTNGSNSGTSLTERTRIDSSGNFMVATTSTGPAVSSSETGIALGVSGYVAASRSGDASGFFNRLASDGAIVNFNKDGTTVGNIGAASGDMYTGTGDTGVRFSDAVDAIYPVSASTGFSRDAAVDLGYSTVRYKDLWLSSGIKNSNDLTIDVAGNIHLDADGSNIIFKDNAFEFGKLSNGGGNVELHSPANVSLRPNNGTSATGNTVWMQGSPKPWQNDYFDLGSSSYKWNDLYLTGDMYMGYRLYHDGDTDTYMQFDNNVIYLIAGGASTFIGASSYSATYVPMYNYAAYFEETAQLSGTTPTINAAASGVFYLTMSGNTTFTFTGTSSNWGIGFILYLTGNGSTVTWPNSVDWAGGTAPDAPASGETDVLVFHTRDGSNWVGVLASDAAS